LLIGATLDASNPNVGKNITAVKTQLDTIKTIITEDYHQSLDSINSTLVKYEDQFETKEFNYKHKDNVLVAYYSNRLNDSMSDQFSELNLVYRNSEKRADMVAKMQSEINTYLALNEAKIYVDRKDDEDSTSESRLVIVPMINNVNKKSVEQLNEINQRLDKISSVEGNTIYDYQKPMLIFSSFGILAFLLGIWLKIEDKKKGYGLELPNKKK